MNTCQKCIGEDGGCCTNVVITIHKSEAAKFLEMKVRNKLPKGHKLENDYVDKDLLEYDSNKERCMFLNEFNNCSIYMERPTICRTYPVMWAKRRFKMNYFVDTSCPLTSDVPVRAMVGWTENLPNSDLINQIGELDINTRDKDYINLTVVSSKIKSENEKITPYLRK